MHPIKRNKALYCCDFNMALCMVLCFSLGYGDFKLFTLVNTCNILLLASHPWGGCKISWIEYSFYLSCWLIMPSRWSTLSIFRDLQLLLASSGPQTCRWIAKNNVADLMLYIIFCQGSCSAFISLLIETQFLIIFKKKNQLSQYSRGPLQKWN